MALQAISSPDLILEHTWWGEGFRYVVGVDEAGRGALFGPVVAAAVILPQGWSMQRLPRLADSKLLTPNKREELYAVISAESVSMAIGVSLPGVVDEVGIVEATLQAMDEAIRGLNCCPDMGIVDGLGPLPRSCRCCAMIDADALCASVAAASIVAKVTRDRMVAKLARSYPNYGLERNKGYGTKEHLEALNTLGPTPLHRMSFAPVRDCQRER